jgi:cell division protease FtsH
MMGGRAVERLVVGDLSSGAANDLQQATTLARRMVEEFGMSAKMPRRKRSCCFSEPTNEHSTA